MVKWRKPNMLTKLNMNQRISFIEWSAEFSTQKYRSETDLKLAPAQIIVATMQVDVKRGQEASPSNYCNSSPTPKIHYLLKHTNKLEHIQAHSKVKLVILLITCRSAWWITARKTATTSIFHHQDLIPLKQYMSRLLSINKFFSILSLLIGALSVHSFVALGYPWEKCHKMNCNKGKSRIALEIYSFWVYLNNQSTDPINHFGNVPINRRRRENLYNKNDLQPETQDTWSNASCGPGGNESYLSFSIVFHHYWESICTWFTNIYTRAFRTQGTTSA